MMSGEVDANLLINDMFGYLDDEEDADAIDAYDTSIPLMKDDEDLSEYKFSKFVATYFNVSPHICKNKHTKVTTLSGLYREC